MSDTKTMINDLTRGPVARLLLLFAYPFALSNLLQLTYNMVDMIIIGQYVGSVGLSGVSIGTDYLHLFTFFGMGFSSAGQILISQYVGAGNRDQIRHTIGTLFSFITLFALCLTAVSVLLIDPLLKLMNTPAQAWDAARDYALVCFWGLVFVFGYNVVSAILRGMGDSKRPFVFISVAAVVNVILDLLFVIVFEMGAFGAALATVMGQGFSFIASLIYLYIRREAFGFDFKPASFRIHGPTMKRLARLGLPMALQHTAVSLSSMFVGACINNYGVAVSAITGIGNKLRSVLSIVTHSVGAAGSSMIGQNIGAGKVDRVKRVVMLSLTINVSAAVLVSALFLLFPEEIIGLFNTDPEVLAMAPSFMLIQVFGFFAMATMSPFNSLINGIGHASLSLTIGLLDGVVTRIGLSVLLGFVLDLGVVGFWYGTTLAGFMTSLLAAGYYFSGRWKTRKLIIEK